MTQFNSNLLKPCEPSKITNIGHVTIGINRALNGIEFPFATKELPDAALTNLINANQTYQCSDKKQPDFSTIKTGLVNLGVAANVSQILRLGQNNSMTYYMVVFSHPIRSLAA